MIVSLIAAMGSNRELGLNGKLLWHIPEDFKHFKKTTLGHHMVMGRKTYESIGRLLPGRTTIILTSQKDFEGPEGAVVCHSKDDVYKYMALQNDNELFIAGGGEIYQLFLNDADKIYLSKVDFSGDADTYFPQIDENKWVMESEKKFGPTDKSQAWSLMTFISKC